MAAEDEAKIRNCMNEKHLLAARDLLRDTLKNSTALTRRVDETSHRLDKFRRRLHSLEADLQHFPNKHLCFLNEHFNWAVRPTDAVLKAFDSVHHLETSLTSSSAMTLSTYISTVKRLEEALRFLTNSCTLAIQWLNGTVEFIQDDVIARERYLDKVNNCLCTIHKLQAVEEQSHLRGGTLDIALNNLEDEFKKILDRQGTSLTCPEWHQLQTIIERLSSNKRLDKCISEFIQVRTRDASETLKSLGLDYLEADVHNLESCITKWKQHLVFAVTEVFENEYLLCRKVFEAGRGETWTRCFVGIALQSGFCNFLQFGIKVAEEEKKSPIRLLNLLDIFSTLDDLRPTFARLFGGDACKEIKDVTRDLVKKVVEGCWEIFWELSYQVELQRETDPPSDGGVPRMVSFVTDYCNQLLGDAYRESMIQVLMIYHSWKREKYQEGLFTNQMYNVMKQIGLNLDSWSKAYDDRALSYLFMMNNHSHLCSLRGTKLGVMMGESWVKAHQQYRDNCAVLYVKESWDKISVRDENNLRTFNEMFQSLYQKHLQWIIHDEKMRVTVLKRIVESIVPAYRSCLIKRHGGDSCQVRVRSSRNGNLMKIISVQAMEDMIRSLFQPSGPRKGVGKDNLIKTTDKIVNVLADSRYSLTLTTA